MAKRWTPEQEISVATKMRQAEQHALELIRDIDVAKEILDEPKDSRGEKTNSRQIDRLRRAVDAAFLAYRDDPDLKQKARKAKQHMANANELRWKLAMSGDYIAVAEARKRSNNEQDCRELEQVGRIGLLDAALRFDPKRRIRFSTYSRWWVVARMTRFSSPFPVRVTPSFREKHRRVHKVIRKLEANNSEWTIEDLAGETRMSTSQVMAVLDQPFHRISLSTPIDEGTSEHRQTLLEGMLEDPSAANPAQEIHQARQQARLLHHLSNLSEVKRRVIELRFGLNDGTWRTLADVGIRFGVSRERIRQIEHEALVELRDAMNIPEPSSDDTRRGITEEWIRQYLGHDTSTTLEICESFYRSRDKTARSKTRRVLDKMKRQGRIQSKKIGRCLHWSLP